VSAADGALRVRLTVPVTEVGIGPFSILCGAPHKKDYAESSFMQSHRSTSPCWGGFSAQATPHNAVPVSNAAAVGGGHA
jgi:hypothetical protein